MPREIQTPKTKAGTKGKPLGIPTWGWSIGAVLGLVIGYMLVKRTGSGSASDSGNLSSPLGANDTGESGGGAVASPSPDQNPNYIQYGGGNNAQVSSPSGPTDIAPSSTSSTTDIFPSPTSDITPIYQQINYKTPPSSMSPIYQQIPTVSIPQTMTPIYQQIPTAISTPTTVDIGNIFTHGRTP